jgi:aspartyl-tRNA(Asn)/glutamyl-tRNA(Gln) amidotransferase subunit A
MRDLHELTIASASKLLAERELSPVELTRSLLERIESLDPQVNAFLTVTAERAMDDARRAEQEIGSGRYRGPLHGIPVGLKDIYYTAGTRTTAHSKVASDFVPAFDATTTKKLAESGAVLLGKTATHEFAHGGPCFDLPWPPARNPWNLAHFTGGSSSGSAAGIAAGFMFGALGTDTGGSIRKPASYCGVVGLKPTYGRVSRYGVIPNSFSLDHCGPLTWTVEDCAIMLGAIAGFDPNDPASADVPVPDYRRALGGTVKGMRIGVLRHLWEEDSPVSDELARATDDAIAVLQKLGAHVETARIARAQDYYDAKMIIGESEAFAIHQADFQRRPQDYGSHYIGRVLIACLFQSGDFVRAQRRRRRLVRDMQPLYERYDALITPGLDAAPVLAPDTKGFWDNWQTPNIPTVFDVTGSPAIVVCSGFAGNGLPLGLQIAGRPFDEATVLRIADAYERATNWRTSRPRLAQAAPLASIEPPPHAHSSKAPDPQTRAWVDALCRRAGLDLPEHLLLQLCEAAPYALAMVDRIPMGAWEDEPANVFTLTRQPSRFD